MFDSYAMLALVFLVAGTALLVAEVFLPSGGILAILTSITLSLALVSAYTAWFRAYPLMFWTFCALEMLTVPVALGMSFYFLPRTRFGKAVLLEAPELEDVVPYAEETARLVRLVGSYGKSLTLLNPGGLILVDGQRLHAFTEGLPVEPGSSVQILEVRGMRVLVQPGEPVQQGEPVTAPLTTANDDRDTGTTPTPTTQARPSPLDFDLPAE